MSEKRPKLAACPFCGSKTVSNEVCYLNGESWSETVACFECGCNGPPCETAEEARRLWNLRVEHGAEKHE